MIKRIFPILALATFASMLGVGIIAPLIPVYSRNMGATGLWIGVIIASYSVSKALIMPVLGRLSDRHGRRIFLIIGLASYAGLSLAYIWASTPITLALVRVVHGAAGGMVLPVARAWIGDATPEGQEGTWQGYFNTVWFGGMGFGPLMGGILNDQFGMSAVFLSMGGLSIIACLAVVFFLREAAPARSHRKPRISFKAMSASGVFRGVFALKIIESIGRRSFFVFLPVFAVFTLGMTTSQVGILLTADTVTSSLLQAPAGKLADKFPRRALVIIASVIGAAYMVVAVFASNFWLLLSVVLVAGIRASMTSGATSALMVEEGRKHGMGSTMAMFSMAVSIGEGVGPLFGGLVVDYVGITGNFYVAAVVMLLAAIVFAWFTRTRSDKPAPAAAEAEVIAARKSAATQDEDLG